MSFLRLADGSLHLVPDRHELYAEVSAGGIDISMVAPWGRWDERSDGLTRAAKEIVRACRDGRS